MTRHSLPSLSKSKPSLRPRLLRIALLGAVAFSLFQAGRLYEEGRLDDTLETIEAFIVAQRTALTDFTSALF